jgi:hypothetical protein
VSRCLVIAPSHADLSALRAVLGEMGAEITTTTQLLVGADLAKVSLDGFDVAIAVLPRLGPDGRPSATAPALYVEIGIVLGRGLPLFVLAEDADRDLPLAGGLAPDLWIHSGSHSEEILRLHLGLFVEVVTSQGVPDRPVLQWEPLPDRQVPRRRPREIRGPDLLEPEQSTVIQEVTVQVPYVAAKSDLDQVALDLLRRSGAKIEANAENQGGELDAVVLMPGTEHVLGRVYIELKTGRRKLDIDREVQQLATKAHMQGALIALLVYSGRRRQPSDDWQWVVVMHIDELAQEVERKTLGRTLVKARNDFVHGRHGGA